VGGCKFPLQQNNLDRAFIVSYIYIYSFHLIKFLAFYADYKASMVLINGTPGTVLTVLADLCNNYYIII
jgi:hypothetical protein